MDIENYGSGSTSSTFTQTVLIDFKVTGGGSVKEGSGRAIATALKSIFASSEISSLTQLNVTLNPDSIKNLQQELEKQLKSIGSLTVGVTAKVTGVDTKGATIAVPATVVTGNVSGGTTSAAVSGTNPKLTYTSSAATGTTSSKERRAEIAELKKHIEGLNTALSEAKQKLESVQNGAKHGRRTQDDIDNATDAVRALETELRDAIALKKVLTNNSARMTVARAIVNGRDTNDLGLWAKSYGNLDSVISSWRSHIEERIINKDEVARNNRTSSGASPFEERLAGLKSSSPTLRETEQILEQINARLLEIGDSANADKNALQELGTLKELKYDLTYVQKEQAYQIAVNTFSKRKRDNFAAALVRQDELRDQIKFDRSHAKSAEIVRNQAVRDFDKADKSYTKAEARLAKLESDGGSESAITTARKRVDLLRDEVDARTEIVNVAQAELDKAKHTLDVHEEDLEKTKQYIQKTERQFLKRTDEVLAGRKEGKYEEEAGTDYSKKEAQSAQEVTQAKEQEASARKKVAQAKREESAVSDREAPPEYNAGIPEGYLETADAINKETESILENQQVKQSDSTAGSETTASTSAEANAHNQNADALNNEASAREQNETTKQQQESNDTTYSQILDQVTAKQKKYANVLGETTTESQQLSAQWNQLISQVRSQSISTEEAQTQLKRLSASTKEYADSVRRANNEQTQLSGIMVKARMYYDQYANTIGRNKQLSQSWDTYFDSIRSGKYTAQEARRELNGLLIASKDAGVEVRRLGNRIKESFLHRIGFTLSSMTFGAVIGSLRKIYKNVTDIDAAMTQLRIITQQTEGAYEAFGNKVASVAKDIGRSITDVISSAETWARLGYSLSESTTLAGATGVFANVAAVSESEATTSLTSVLKAYDYAADDAMHIVDILTQVGQKYAISASELGTALTKGGAALATAGNTLEESVALMAAGNAAVQNAETVGTALKTTTLRLAGSKAELEELGEDVDDLASSTSKMRKEIKALSGVDIMKDAKNYKSTFQILKEIAAVWDKIDNVSQMTLLEDLAGKRNASVIASVINNLQDLEGAYKDATNSTGVAAKAQATYMDSIAGKQAKMTAQFQDFSQNLLDSDIIKVVMDIGNAFMWLMAQGAKTGVLLPTIAAGITLVAKASKALKFEESVGAAAKTLTSLGPAKENIGAYAVQLSLLTPKMREATIAKANLRGENLRLVESEMALEAQELITARLSDEVKLEDFARAASKAKLTDEMWKQVLAEAGLANATDKLTKDEAEELLLTLAAKAADENLTDAEREQYLQTLLNIKATQGQTAANGLLATSFEMLGAAIKSAWAFLKAHPLAAVVGAFALVGAILLKVRKTRADYLNDAKEELDEAKDLQSKLDGIKSELDELIARRKELLSLGKDATLEQINELDTVNKRIAALEHENKILEEQAKLKGKESYNDLLNAYGGKTFFDDLSNARTIRSLPTATVAQVLLPREMVDFAKDYAETRPDISQLARDYGEIARLNNAFDMVLGEGIRGTIFKGNMSSYANRPFLNSAQMQNAGWVDFPEGYSATTYFDLSDYGIGDALHGSQWTIQVTPILDDGTILSPDALSDYMNKITAGASGINDILARDKDENNIIAAWSKGTYEDSAREWDAFNDRLSLIKERHAEVTEEVKRLQQAISNTPGLWDAVYGKVDMSDADDFTDALSKENDELSKREELISGLEDLGYEYNKNAQTEAEKEFNNIVKETRLRRDMWMIASGSADAYRQTLEDLVEFEILPMDQIEEFLEKMSDPEWAKTSEGVIAIAQMAQILKSFGVNVSGWFGGVDADKLHSVLTQFVKDTKEGTSALEDEARALESLQDLQDSIGALAKAEKEMASTGYLSYDTYQKLTGLKLNDYIEKVAGGYKLAKGAMSGYISASRSAIAADLEQAKTALNTAKEMLAAAKLKAEAARISPKYSPILGVTLSGGLPASVQQALTLIQKAYDEADARVAKLQGQLSDFDRNTQTFLRDATGSSSSSSSSSDPHLEYFKERQADWKHQLEMGQITRKQYIQYLREVISPQGHFGRYGDKYLDEIRGLEEEIRQYDLDVLDKQKDAFESLVDFRIKQLEEETKKQKEELDKRKENLEDFYDKQIKMLEDQFDEEDYLEEQAEKRKELADMRQQMAMLERDDSAWARKKLAELQDEYDKVEKEYRKWEEENARDIVKQTLEDEQDAALKAIEAEQEALEKRAEDQAALRKQAIADILSGNATVMEAMEAFSIEQGTWLEDNIVAKWNLAYEAVQKYGKGVAAITALNSVFGADRWDNETYRVLREFLGGEYQQHAAGTSNARGGWAVTQENGPEAILRRAGGLFTLLNPGDKVLNAGATNFLYAFANNPGAILASSMSSLLSRNSLSPAYAGMSGNSTINIDTGDVIIQGNADEKTVSEFRREKRKLVNEILQEFKKLK